MASYWPTATSFESIFNSASPEEAHKTGLPGPGRERLGRLRPIEDDATVTQMTSRAIVRTYGYLPSYMTVGIPENHLIKSGVGFFLHRHSPERIRRWLCDSRVTTTKVRTFVDGVLRRKSGSGRQMEKNAAPPTKSNCPANRTA
jgi:hypothetical protein